MHLGLLGTAGQGYAAGFSSRPGTGVKINPTPTSGLDPGMLPNITEDYFVGFKKRMDDAETAKHRKWDFKGRGRHRDLLQVRSSARERAAAQLLCPPL